MKMGKTSKREITFLSRNKKKIRMKKTGENVWLLGEKNHLSVYKKGKHRWRNDQNGHEKNQSNCN